MPEQNNKFKIGLCMAGAISAGAYTAGAIDYLIEALEDWQTRKDNNEPNTPSHEVEISIIGGASAGGMMGIIAASAIQDKIEPVQQLGKNIMDKKPNNKFYHSWVDLIEDEMLSLLLDTSDISDNVLESVLNSTFIDKIAERALNVSNDEIRRKYISNNLKVFVTLSNLEGMDFSAAFKANLQKLNRYIIKSHNDYACFKLCNSQDDYTNDGWIPLNFKSKLNTSIAKDAAMATGAFPVGLKARKVSRPSKYMNDLDWFKHITKDAEKRFKGEYYETINVDGGMINNEPFDKIRDLLIEETKPKEQNAPFDKIRDLRTEEAAQKEQDEIHDYNKFKSTILMIDPFPSEKKEDKKKKDEQKERLLTSIMGKTLGAIIDQARIKPSLLIDAMDSNKAGQFLIAPVRYKRNGNLEEAIEGEKAIACGSLSGFGGFISKKFRIHDYFLGRANCEKFLRDHFTVPINSTNEIFVKGYSGVTNKKPFISKSNGDERVQIIPIFSTQKPKPYMPQFSNGKEWPEVKEDYIKSYRSKIKARIGKIICNISDNPTLLLVMAKVLLSGKIADVAIEKVIESLIDHEIIKK